MKPVSSDYVGYEETKHRLIMTSKMYMEVAFACIVAQIVAFISIANFIVDPLNFGLAMKYPFACLSKYCYLHLSFNLPIKGQIIPVDAAEIASLMPHEIYLSAAWATSAMFSFVAWFCAPIMLGYFRGRTNYLQQDEHVRGAKLITEDEVAAAARKVDCDGIIPIGSKIILPEAFECRHFLCAGQTGSGKSTVLFQLMDAVQSHQRRCLTNDFKGELVEKFYRPVKDLILNPLDARGLGWTIFNELQSKPDLSAIAGSLIPVAKGEDRFWSAAAQDVLRGVLAFCFNAGKRTNADLWNALTAPISNIAEMCAATPSGQAGLSYIQDASGKQAAGVIAVLMSYVSWLEYANDGSFSLREWSTTPGDQTIYLTTREEVANTLRPYLSLFADLCGKRLLALPDNHDKPEDSIYLLLDEFANMQRLPTVKRLLTAGRSKKIKVIIGTQEIAGLQSIYGPEDTKSIINNCGSKLILNVGDPDTAEYFSKLAGDQEYWQASRTISVSQDDSKGGENHSRQIQTRKVIMPSEIMRLEVGNGYFMLPGGNPAAVNIPWSAVNKRKVVNEGFILRDGFSLDQAEVLDKEITMRAETVLESVVPDELRNKVEENAIKRIKEEKEAEEKLEGKRQLDPGDTLTGGLMM
jgi:type IV secretory pathway TraG/TraD family ATPase VirD4